MNDVPWMKLLKEWGLAYYSVKTRPGVGKRYKDRCRRAARVAAELALYSLWEDWSGGASAYDHCWRELNAEMALEAGDPPFFRCRLDLDVAMACQPRSLEEHQEIKARVQASSKPSRDRWCQGGCGNRDTETRVYVLGDRWDQSRSLCRECAGMGQLALVSGNRLIYGCPNNAGELLA